VLVTLLAGKMRQPCSSKGDSSERGLLDSDVLVRACVGRRNYCSYQHGIAGASYCNTRRTRLLLPLLVAVAAATVATNSVATYAFVARPPHSAPSFVVGPRAFEGRYSSSSVSRSARRRSRLASASTGGDGSGRGRGERTRKSQHDSRPRASDTDIDDGSEWNLKSSSGRSKRDIDTYSGRYVNDNGLKIVTDEEGRVTARPAPMAAAAAAAVVVPIEDDAVVDNIEDEDDAPRREEIIQNEERENATEAEASAVGLVETKPTLEPLAPAAGEGGGKPKIIIKGNKPKPISPKKQLKEHPVQTTIPSNGFNVVLTHCTADFDSLASAVGLARLWSSKDDDDSDSNSGAYKSSSNLPTFVVLPRGAHPGVQKFLALHKHLFPIRSLKSLPSDLSNLNRLGLVDAQRRDRLGPAEHLLGFAKRVTIVDHHIDGESDIPEASDYVAEKVGSVSTMIAERLRDAGLELSEAEATLLALGIHADTGSLCFDSTTARDAGALAWAMEQGASQAAIAEHGKSSLSPEQQGVLTQALINTNTTEVHGVTISTVLLSAEGFINGLAAVAQDALELTSSDVYLLTVVYDAKSGSGRKRKQKKKRAAGDDGDHHLRTRLFGKLEKEHTTEEEFLSSMMTADAWKGGETAQKRRRLKAAFDKKDKDGSGYLERGEIAAVLGSSGIICSKNALDDLFATMDTNSDGRIDFEEFIAFCEDAERRQSEQEKLTGRRQSTMIIIGRVRAGINTKDVNLNKLFQQFGGGGHAKAASATVRLADEGDAGGILQGIVAEMIDTSLMKQPTVGDFMTSPVLSTKPTMTEKHVEDLFIRYDVRSLPVVDDDNNVIGLVTYKEVAAAKQRLWNKEQKRIRQEAKLAQDIAAGKNVTRHGNEQAMQRKRNQGSALKGWMLQHVEVVEASKTMAEVEAALLDADVGCMPVVADGTKQLVGMVTRTDLLRQHRYYDGLHYNNKGFADSIAARKPIIELRKRLKKYDLDE